MACSQAELHVLQKLLPTLTTLEVLLLDIDWEFENWTAQRRLNLGSLTALKQLSLQMCFSFRGRQAWDTCWRPCGQCVVCVAGGVAVVEWRCHPAVFGRCGAEG